MCYINGGQPAGADKNYLGCSDRTPPKADKTITIHHELYFSKSSKVWENRGVAFLKAEMSEGAKTLGRMYLITTEQFVQVVRQENAKEINDKAINIDYKKTILGGQSLIDGNWYNKILYLGDDDGYPIFTFTSNWSDSDIELNAPGEKYIKTIIIGIKETYSISSEAVFKYLASVEGIRGLIDKNKLMKLVSEVE